MVEGLSLMTQIELAIREPRTRYIMIAAIGGEEYDVGEAMIGPQSDAEKTHTDLVQNMDRKLRGRSLTASQIANATIVLIEAPLLY